MRPPSDLNQLRERLRDLGQTRPEQGRVPLVTGDSLRLGALHEWFGVGGGPGDWQPALSVLMDIARRALPRAAHLVWIGRACWPYPRCLDSSPGVLRASVFIDPPDDASRLWAIDSAARCAAPTVVIADGSRMKLVHTRRLHLSAAAGGAQEGGGLCLLARPSGEEGELSAATTRWRVARCVSPTAHARWTITPLRNKDHPARTGDAEGTVVEWNDAQGLVRISAALARRTDHAATAAG